MFGYCGAAAAAASQRRPRLLHAAGSVAVDS